MTRLDLSFVRAQFPAFAEPSLAGFAHFENAGGSFASRQTIESLDRYYRQTKVQPYYSFEPSATAGAQMDRAKARLAAWLNVGAEELHLGPSTSQNTYVLAQAFRKHLQPGDEVIVTNQDHEANIGAWSRLQDDGIVLRTWPVDRDGELRIADLDALLGRRTRLVAFTQCSNVVGTIHPVREITDRIHRAGAWAVVDGVSFCPHGLPDVPALGADVYLFSLYKVYGPHQGAMYVRRDLAAALPSQAHFFKGDAIAGRFTPAGPDHAQVAAVNGVVDYLEAVAEHHGYRGRSAQEQALAVHDLFRAAETERLQPLLDFLAGRPGVRLIGRRNALERAPTVAFRIDGRSSAEIAKRLAGQRIGVGSGNFYAYRLLQALGIDTADGVVRTSFVHYTTADEVERLIQALAPLLA
ncbi:MAG TPA: aminotransferase class V-fold PLP-dependent enzyme [Steroidobacteraceae bacterium]